MSFLPQCRLGLAALAFLVVVPAEAHHSAKIFESTVIALPGTVTRYGWTNPHTYIYVETLDQNGEAVEWEIETDAIPILVRSGWGPDSFAPGDEVLIRARPDRNRDRRHALLVSAEKADGTVLAARTYFLAREEDLDTRPRATDFSGIWELRFEDYGRYYASWAQVRLTEAGAAASAAYDVRLDSPAAQCVAAPLPSLLVAPYLFEIEIRDNAVVLRNERFNAERFIWTDGRGHPENGERTNHGHSIGHWEGDTLVVDTTLFADHRAPISGQQGNEGVPAGAQKHVVERYRLSEDRTRLLIDFVLEDPEFLAEPFTGSVQWFYAPHFEYLGFGCDVDISLRYTLQ
ncbi:MAG: hypothetical protein HKN84_08385 [Gammaproteobacteria bacterium]|nr:hypothetical protein [Gammaproteobacteria bacterium]